MGTVRIHSNSNKKNYLEYKNVIGINIDPYYDGRLYLSIFFEQGTSYYICSKYESLTISAQSMKV